MPLESLQGPECESSQPQDQEEGFQDRSGKAQSQKTQRRRRIKTPQKETVRVVGLDILPLLRVVPGPVHRREAEEEPAWSGFSFETDERGYQL